MGVLQGSCTSPILTAYFTAPLGEAIKQGFRSMVDSNPELSHTFNPSHNSLAPLTLYVDDGSIAASAHNQPTATRMVKIAFREAHKWLTMRGLKLNQVKNELIHFMKSTRGRHTGEGPSITIPTNMPGELKTLKPAKLIRYLGMWLDSQLKFNDHIQKTTTKALTATHALKLLGNLIRGIHQSHARQIYIHRGNMPNCHIWPPHLLEIQEWKAAQHLNNDPEQMLTHDHGCLSDDKYNSNGN